MSLPAWRRTQPNLTVGPTRGWRPYRGRSTACGRRRKQTLAVRSRRHGSGKSLKAVPSYGVRFDRDDVADVQRAPFPPIPFQFERITEFDGPICNDAARVSDIHKEE